MLAFVCAKTDMFFVSGRKGFFMKDVWQVRGVGLSGKHMFEIGREFPENVQGSLNMMRIDQH